jgi:hypothetical protein
MLSHNTKDDDSLFRSYALACAYLLDHDKNYKKPLTLLTFLFNESIKPENKISLSTVMLITNIYGLALKLDPKMKGEALAYLEQVKEYKITKQSIEKAYYLRVDNYNLTIDYDKQTLEYIENNKI